MRRYSLFCTLLCGLLLTSGCSSSDPDTVDATGAESTESKQGDPNSSTGLRTALPPTNGNKSVAEEEVPYIKAVPLPAVVAEVFLKATSSGDIQTAAAQLTTVAQEKQKIKDSLPQTNSAIYKIVETEYPQEYPKNSFGDHAGAHVLCHWSEKNQNGELKTTDVIFMMKREPDSWRIQGMLIRIDELGGRAVAFDFENPQLMYQKVEEINQDILQKNKKATSVANRPKNKPMTERK